MKRTFIRNICGMRLNGNGVDLYTRENGEAVLQHDNNTVTSDIRIRFESLDEAEIYLSNLEGNKAGKLQTLLERMGVFSPEDDDNIEDDWLG